MPTTPDSPIFAVREFSFALGGKTILDRISFDVRSGESLAVVGPNGAGKTTLLKCLNRILVGGSGEIVLDGRPLAGYSRKQLARWMSYVPQADAQAVAFTVEQFVLMGRYPYLSPFSPIGRSDREAVREAMSLTGTAALADRLLGTLSGGERQKVYLAAALAQGAPIMLLDEPTTFLDYHHQDEIGELLARTAAITRRTTISVTHDVNRAALGSDRIVALRDGRVVFDGPPHDIMRPDELQRIYGSPFLLVAHPQTGLPMIVPRAVSGEPS
jgi:iron complex transport system ATP-binding protein